MNMLSYNGEQRLDPKERHLHQTTQVVLVIGLILTLVCLGVRLRMKYYTTRSLDKEDSKSAPISAPNQMQFC
jgi:hypothetical protein